jgi:hypothetical protein
MPQQLAHALVARIHSHSLIWHHGSNACHSSSSRLSSLIQSRQRSGSLRLRLCLCGLLPGPNGAILMWLQYWCCNSWCSSSGSGLRLRTTNGFLSCRHLAALQRLTR